MEGKKKNDRRMTEEWQKNDRRMTEEWQKNDRRMTVNKEYISLMGISVE